MKMELLEKGTKFHKVLDNGDGTQTVSVFSYPIHFQDEQGNWNEIDNNIYPNDKAGKAYDYVTNANDFRVAFKSKADAKDFIRFSHKGETKGLVTFTLGGLYLVDTVSGQRQKIASPDRKSSIQVIENKASYSGVFPGVTVEFEVISQGLKENVILDEATKALIPDPMTLGMNPESCKLVVLVNVSSKHGKKKRGDRGRIAFLDMEGLESIWVEPTTAEDANGAALEPWDDFDETSGDYFYGISYNNTQNAVYPITIDPTLISSGSNSGYIQNSDSPAWSVYTSQSTDKIGNYSSTSGTWNVYRHFDKFDISSYENHTIYGSCSYQIYVTQSGSYSLVADVINDFGTLDSNDWSASSVFSMNGFNTASSWYNVSYGLRDRLVYQKKQATKILGIRTKAGSEYSNNYSNRTEHRIHGGSGSNKPKIEFSSYSSFTQNTPTAASGKVTVDWINVGGLSGLDRHFVYYRAGTWVSASDVIAGGTKVTSSSSVDTSIDITGLTNGQPYSFVVVDAQYYSGNYYEGARSTVQQAIPEAIVVIVDTDSYRKVKATLAVGSDSIRGLRNNTQSTADSGRGIHNSIVSLGDSLRKVQNSALIGGDSFRKARNFKTVESDSYRKVRNNLQTSQDLLRRTKNSVQGVMDTLRKVTTGELLAVDSFRKVRQTYAVPVDSLRKLRNVLQVDSDSIRIVRNLITLGTDSLRKLRANALVGADSFRRARNLVNVAANTLRNVQLMGGSYISADTRRKVVKAVAVPGDSRRKARVTVVVPGDTFRKVLATVTAPSDLARKLRTITQAQADSARKVRNNIQTTLDTTRRVTNRAAVHVDSYRKAITAVVVGSDTYRIIYIRSALVINSDTMRKVTNSAQVVADTYRQVVNVYYNMTATIATHRKVRIKTAAGTDSKRRIRNTVVFINNSLRRVRNYTHVTGDSYRKLRNSLLVSSDSRRTVRNSVEIVTDSMRRVRNSFTPLLDTFRRVATVLLRKSTKFNWEELPERYDFSEIPERYDWKEDDEEMRTFLVGEEKEVGIEVMSQDETLYSITNANYVYKDTDGTVIEEGTAYVDGNRVYVLLKPTAPGYLQRVIFSVSLQPMKEDGTPDSERNREVIKPVVEIDVSE